VIDVNNVKNIVLEEYPNIKLEMNKVDTSNKYEIIESVLDDKISFRNICAGGNFGVMTDEEFASALIETIVVQMNGYKKLDRAQILRDKTTIIKMDQMSPNSFHKLTPSELEDKIVEYDIKKDEFTRAEIKKVENKKESLED